MRFLAAVILGMLLTACAPLPILSTPQSAKSIDDYQTGQSFSAAEAAWPTDDWWVKYHDPQLNTLIHEGLEASPDMKIAQARLSKAMAVSESVASALYPQLNASAQVDRVKLSGGSVFPPGLAPQGWNNVGFATLNFNWEIDFWGKNRSALAAAVSDAQAVRTEQAQAKLVLTSSIAQTYAELARYYKVRETTKRAYEIRDRTFMLFTERQHFGLENSGPVSQAEAKKLLAENELIQIEVRIAEQKNKLAALVGAGPDRGLEIVQPTVNFDNRFSLPPELAMNLIGRRPDIIAARWQAQSGESRIEQKKAEFFPNINLAAFVGVLSSGLDKTFNSNTSFAGAGPAIYLPIFEGGRLRAGLNTARAGYDESVANYEKTVVQSLQEVADVVANMKVLDQQIQLSDKSVAAATKGLLVAQNRYKGGLSNYLDVLTAEDELLTNLRVQTDLRARSFSLDVALTKALGGGFQSDPTKDRIAVLNTEEFPK